MISTTIEQSKHLLELGLDPNTADMYYTGHRSIHNPKEIEYTQEPRVRTKLVSFDRLEVFFPAWSLQALLEVMPKEKVIGFYFITTLKEWCFTIKHNETKHHFTNEDKLTAAYEMVCWLLENDLIKKGDNDE